MVALSASRSRPVAAWTLMRCGWPPGQGGHPGAARKLRDHLRRATGQIDKLKVTRAILEASTVAGDHEFSVSRPRPHDCVLGYFWRQVRCKCSDCSDGVDQQERFWLIGAFL